MGMKIYDTHDDKKKFPLTLKIIDTPGKVEHHPAQVKYCFQKPHIVFVVLDFSIKLERKDVVKWTAFAIEKV